MRSLPPARRVRMLAALALMTIAGITSTVNATGATGADGAQDQARHDAVVALKVERDLTGRAGDQAPTIPQSLRDQIKVVDDRGAVLLTTLVADGFVPSANVRATLGPLPRPRGVGDPPRPPTRDRYDAAIRELGGDPGVPPVQTVSAGGWTSTMLLVLVAVAALSAVAATLLVVMLRRRKDKRLVELATTDSLTALYNRRRLDGDLLVCSEKQQLPVAVLMVDVDNFKLVNDRQGHSAGDRVLKRVGAALAQHVRPNDIVYRYGGEEFCVLLPNATQADALDVAERIRHATSELRIPGSEAVTVSVGVATGAGADVLQTLERADAAMYDAKRDGRDRVVVAPVTVGSGACQG